MAHDNQELKEAIGGVADLDIVLEKNSINPMSFHVAYIGGGTDLELLNSNTEIVLLKQFAVYVVLNMDKFNGRAPQSLVPIVEEQLMHSLWGWHYDDLVNHGPMMYVSDNVEYTDLGRYVHSFRFAVEYTVQYTADEIHQDDGNITPFDTLINTYLVGKDDADNDITSVQNIVNIYNEGDPL
tara:strand:+ start:9989 stop:10534 length:546 start_codon:yes stop_codon:yes gene_type:complete